MFNSFVDDDDLFIQPQSSNLAALFDSNETISSGNIDLMYVAPKQPRNDMSKQKIDNPKIQSSVLFAKVVRVYKPANDAYKIIGKYGLALIGDSIKLKEIMLYKDKQNILARAAFKCDFQICIEDDYINFHDNNNEKWYVQFEEEKNLREFLDELRKVNIRIVEIIKEKVHDNSSEVGNVDSSIKSDNESEESSVSQSRAEILSRMAKMGQSILPNNFLRNESSDTDNSSNSSYMSNKKINTESRVLESSRQLINFTPPSENTKSIPNKISQPFNVSANSSNQIPSFVPIYSPECLPNPTLIPTVIPSQDFNLFISENRMQNSEIRMNLATITTKLDSVINEISKFKEPTNTDKLENEFLKSKIADLERNIGDLTKRLAEASNSTKYFELEMLIKNKDEQIESEKAKVIELQSSLTDLDYTKKKVDEFALQENNLTEEIDKLKAELKNSQKVAEEHHLKYVELKEINEVLKKDNGNLCEKLKKCEVKEKINKNLTQESLDLKSKGLFNTIKDLMNSMFQNILTQLDTNELQHSQTRSILSTNVKQTTFSIIQKFQTFLETTDTLSDPLNNDDFAVK